MSKGQFVVIEGTDGSGKATQTALLIDKLKKLQIPSGLYDFPRYEDNEYGKLVARYLKGEFGGLEQISPYLASLPYAGDRMLAGPEIQKKLEQGEVVITNRYVLSNKAYMAARIAQSDRKQFLDWLDKLEYNVNRVPREDLVIFLYVPLKVSQQNIDERVQKSYLQDKKKDIMEANLKYMQQVEDVYMDLAKQNNWSLIECTSNGLMRSREEIHEEVFNVLNEKVLKL